ncbi:MAG: hypothetical protein O2797_04960 [Bacteroidetes bacterium]|nr:hypothetical protein [Bacteroidota bacterium]MDA1333549.1 hypothetical protein [Bacteroidota bacterium]
MNRLSSSLLWAILLLLMVPALANARQLIPQWKYVSSFPDAPGGRYDDMAFLDPDRGWVVNLQGEIWHTADGAESWVLQDDNDVPYRSIAIRDTPGPFGEVVWAGTVNTNGQSILWETRDSGAHWTDITHRISGDVPYGICGLVSIGDNVWGVGAYYGEPTVIRSVDGGRTWEGRAMQSRLASNLIDVYFKNELEGYATGGTDGLQSGTAVILRTLDGGDTWERVFVSSPTPDTQAEWGWKISFPSKDVGYVSVEYNSGGEPTAKVLKTEDGGATWREQWIEGSVSNAGLQGIGFINETTGWASGRGVTSVTTDGGESWTQLRDYSPGADSGQLDGRMNRFFVVNDTLAYGVGQRLYVVSGYGQLGTDIEIGVTPEIFSLEPLFPNPFTESATLRYNLEAPSRIRIRVADMLGRIQRHFPQRYLQPGVYEEKWDGRNDAGIRVPTGGYILLIDIGESMETKKVLFLQ